MAFYTLGCKVNQYDTQAMTEAFLKAGYALVPFHEKADVYVVNTCTVTGTGDKKSLQILRRARRQNPNGEIVITGCLAQRMGQNLRDTGARLILGTQRRGEIVALLEDAVAQGQQVVAVDSLAAVPFEPLSINSHEGHTRAVIKIQEGCNRHCTYCIIPSVRGPIRSRPLAEIAAEAQRLAAAGFLELVVTGIHLSSYGLDREDNATLADALALLETTPGLLRIRLGSLEPTIITEAFAERLHHMTKLCPQFHLALQSGSDTILRRMGRRYTKAQFMEAVRRLRQWFPGAALTTDILTGFPGETEEEFQETYEACREIGFSRMHVFPYSPREGTPAAAMTPQVSSVEKERRAAALIALSEEMSRRYREAQLGETKDVLIEEALPGGNMTGYTPEYVPVEIEKAEGMTAGRVYPITLTALTKEGVLGQWTGAENMSKL